MCEEDREVCGEEKECELETLKSKDVVGSLRGFITRRVEDMQSENLLDMLADVADSYWRTERR
jgi:hypothetical protein